MVRPDAPAARRRPGSSAPAPRTSPCCTSWSTPPSTAMPPSDAASIPKTRPISPKPSAAAPSSRTASPACGRSSASCSRSCACRPPSPACATRATCCGTRRCRASSASSPAAVQPEQRCRRSLPRHHTARDRGRQRPLPHARLPRPHQGCGPRGRHPRRLGPHHQRRHRRQHRGHVGRPQPQAVRRRRSARRSAKCPPWPRPAASRSRSGAGRRPASSSWTPGRC